MRSGRVVALLLAFGCSSPKGKLVLQFADGGDQPPSAGAWRDGPGDTLIGDPGTLTFPAVTWVTASLAPDGPSPTLLAVYSYQLEGSCTYAEASDHIGEMFREHHPGPGRCIWAFWGDDDLEGTETSCAYFSRYEHDTSDTAFRDAKVAEDLDAWHACED